VLLYSSVNVNIAHIAVQSQPNDRVQQLRVVLFSVYFDVNLTSLVKIFRSALAKILNEMQRCM
jgi:hypothetical protein